MPASAVLVALVVATWPVLAWPLRTRFGARAGIVPPLASLALVPFVVLGAMWAYAEPIADTSRFRCGTGEMAALVLIVPLAAGALTIGIVWARYIASPPGRRRVDATLQRLAVLAVLCGSAFTGLAIARSVHAPDADGWAESLPRVDAPPRAVDQAATEARAAVCPMMRCPQEVHRDDANDLWVITEPQAEGRRPVLVLGPAVVPRTVSPRDLTGVAPPRGWVVEAGSGIVAAVLSLVASWWLARRHRALAAALPALHLGGGWIATHEGMPPVHVPGLEHRPTGPVFVRPGDRRHATYRTTGAPSTLRIVAFGTSESIDDTARSIATVGAAMALALVALACAPLTVV
jgi:hypothetical protein